MNERKECFHYIFTFGGFYKPSSVLFNLLLLFTSTINILYNRVDSRGKVLTVPSLVFKEIN